MAEYSDSGFEDMMEAAGLIPGAQRKGDDALAVRFFIQAIHNPQRTALEGHPIYEDQEMIEIQTPGDRDVLRRIASENDKQRFSRHYELFKLKQDQRAVDGMPLAEWPLITASMREELAHFGIRSVEHLAKCPDAQLQRIGPYLSMRQKARDWLESQKDASAVAKLRNENDALAARVATLERMLQAATAEIQAARGERPMVVPQAAPAPALPDIVAAVMAAMQAQQPPPKRRGRPPKNGADTPKE